MVRLGKVIKSIINKDYSTDAINEIKINNNSTTDKQIIADSFNNYFVNVGPNLANNIPASNGNISSYLTGSDINSMAIHEADPEEIVRLAGSLKNSSCIGNDGIPTPIVKSTINEICGPLTFVINLSLTQGKFPDLLKTAKIIPIHKSDDTLLITNYRPISI